jgi:hypothetical protein
MNVLILSPTSERRLFWLFLENLANPCNENRGKIDDFIAILEPINCALYRDRSRFRQKSVFNHDLIGDFFLENRDKIVQTDDFLRMRIQSPKVTEF